MSMAFNFPPPQVSALRPGEIAVDLFAGGGGASEGLKQALGIDPALAYNHDPAKLARAYRAAAAQALAQGDNQFFTAQERHDNYTAAAIRLEAEAAKCHPGVTA